MQDLVRPRAADAGDQALVAQECMQPARVALQDLLQLRRVELVCLRAEMLELGRGLLGRVEPDTRLLAARVLGEDELGAADELERERRLLRRALAGGQELQPTGRHQVDEQDELAVLRGKEEALAASFDSPELSSDEVVERRVERLQRRDVRRTGLRDREGRNG